MSTDKTIGQHEANTATLVYVAGDASDKRDPKFILDMEKSEGVQYYLNPRNRNPKAGDKGDKVAELTTPDGQTVRFTLRQNIYVPGGEGIESITVSVGLGEVTAKADAPVASGADASGGMADMLPMMVATGSLDAVVALLSGQPGISKAKATVMATALLAQAG